MKAKEYEAIAQGYRSSGQTMREYSERIGVPVNTLHTWVRRTRERHGIREARKSYGEYRAIVLECKQSGRMAKDWCAERGIKYGTYCGWAKKVNQKEGRDNVDRLCGIVRGPYVREPEAKAAREPVLCEIRR